MNKEIFEITEALRTRLKPERFMHSLGVAHTAYSLAICHDYNPEKAYLTGLLHDCGKAVSNDNQLSECEKYGIKLTTSEISKPYDLVHGKLGAYLAYNLYGINDTEIIDAISFHTTGRADMTLLDKIIYVSDSTEPNRREYGKRTPDLMLVRKTSYTDLDTAVYYTIKRITDYLKEQNTDIDENTTLAYNWISKRSSIIL